MRQLSQRKQDPETARAHLGQPRWAPAATTPHIRPQGAPDPPGSLLGLHIHGPGYLPTQGMITRVREQNLGAFSWPATRVPGRRRALGALARSTVRRAQARLRGPRCNLLVSRVTWAHPFTLGTALANTPALGVPPAALLSPEPPEIAGHRMAAPDQGKVRDSSLLRVTQCGAVPAPRGVSAELGGRSPRASWDPHWSGISPEARGVPGPVRTEGLSG